VLCADVPLLPWGDVMFGDWSEDVPRTYDDDEPAGRTDTTWPELPSERHAELLALLYANSHRDRAGRLVSWWLQAKLAGRLGVTTRTLQRLLADLREPGRDLRRPKGEPAGLRLGLVKVETTSRPGRAGGGRLLAGNLYVLVEHQIPRSYRHATRKGPLTSEDSESMSRLNKLPTPSLETEGEYLGVTGVSSTEAPPEVPAVLDVGRQQQPSWADLRLDEHQVLDALRAQLGEVEVVWPANPRWSNRRPTYRPAGRRARPLPLTGDLDDFHAAIDALEADTVPESYAAKVNGRRRDNHARG
jgi:hypothetical protein